MNQIENHITSFELSKQLWDKGFRKESIHCYYVIEDDTEKPPWIIMNMKPTNKVEDIEGVNVYPAYLLSELLEYVPYTVKEHKLKKVFVRNVKYFQDENTWGLMYEYDDDTCLNNVFESVHASGTAKTKDADEMIFDWFWDKSLIQATAKTILWLLQNEYIKPDTEIEKEK